ncbi:MAG: MlaE family lipid ABC transporter permease subunit [Planctomycetes bacterium]|nr:MlaE family lipid ABC transporter permease subunit [Planctomycetota bacterium]
MGSPAFSLHDEGGAGGSVRLALGGFVTLADGAELWARMQRRLRGARAVDVDLGAVERLDGGAAALLHALAREHAAGGGTLQFRGARTEVAKLLDLYACRPAERCGGQAPREPGLLADVGAFALSAVDSTRAILAFTGDLVHGMLQAIRRPRTVHLGDLGGLVERAGTDGVPIVVLVNFLVGAVLGLQGAIQLHRFGGDAFLANLVGLSTVREFGPLMTAILVAGRSGAGYAAELGTMTVNEEIDALRTLGQDPQRFLVFPRVLTLALAVPVLVLLADLAGIVGGLLVAVTYLDQPASLYLQVLREGVGAGDVGTGLLKSLGFAVAIGLIACQRGLATRGGAAGVGRATTSAVVAVLFTLVVLDSLFVNAFSLLGW